MLGILDNVARRAISRTWRQRLPLVAVALVFFRLTGDVHLLVEICWIRHNLDVPPGVELELHVAQLGDDFHVLLRGPVVRHDELLRQETNLSLPALHAVREAAVCERVGHAVENGLVCEPVALRCCDPVPVR
jgi:hypothetical protein